MEKRNNPRINEVGDLQGKLFSVVSFKVQNISSDGLNLICGLAAKIGKTYHVHLKKDEVKKDFRIKIIRAEAHPFDEKYKDLYSEGMLYTIGAKFVDLDEERTSFIKKVIKGKNEFIGEFVIN